MICTACREKHDGERLPFLGGEAVVSCVVRLAELMADRYARQAARRKGVPFVRARGGAPRVAITAEQVLAARKAGQTFAAIGRAFGVSPDTARNRLKDEYELRKAARERMKASYGRVAR